MKRFLSCLFALALTSNLYAQSSNASSEVSQEKRDAIIQLMEITGAADMGKQMAELMSQQMAQGLRQARPDIPPRAFEISTEVAMSIVTEELDSGRFQNMIVPLYDKYFTMDEIQELLAFYRTEIGAKTIAVMPQLTQESIQVGQVWGSSIGPKIVQQVNMRLAAEGIEISPPPSQ